MCLMQLNCTQNMLQFWNMYNFVVVTPGTYSLHNVKSSVYSTEWIKSIVIEFLLFIQFLNLSLLCLHPKKRNQLLNFFSILISDIFWNRPIIKQSTDMLHIKQIILFSLVFILNQFLSLIYHALILHLNMGNP